MIFPRFIIFICLSFLIFSCRENSVPSYSNEPIVQTQSLIKVTSPTYSENWYPGSKQTITWDFEHNISKVDILLFRKDIKVLEIATKIDNTSFYNWDVPSNLNYSHHYRIKIVDSIEKRSEDFSDYFYIIGNPNN